MAEIKFRFEDPITGETLGECSQHQGAYLRAGLYLFKGAEPVNNYQRSLKSSLWGFLCATVEGLDVVKFPKSNRDVNEEWVLDMLDKVSVFIETEGEEEEEEAEESVKNPTETSGEQF